MSNARQAWLGILAALVSSAIIFGSLALTLAENGTAQALIATATSTSSPSPTVPVETVPVGFPTLTPTSTHTPTATSTLEPSVNCPPPDGWRQVEFQVDDTWGSLAQKYGISVDELLQKNCWITNGLPLAGTFVNVPPLPSPTATATPTAKPTRTPTKTSVPCGPPPGWVLYIVRPGDTLSYLSRVLNVSVYQLQRANCLGNSTRIYSGLGLYVPFIPVAPTIIPSWTPVPTTVPPTATSMPPTATSTQPPATVPPPTAVPTQPPPTTAVPTLPPTDTAVPTTPPTDTAVPTQQPTATAVPTEPPPATAVPTPIIIPPTREPPSLTLVAPSPTVQLPSFSGFVPIY